MKILEKVSPKGLSRVELIVNDEIIKYHEYLNDIFVNSGRSINGTDLKEMEKIFISQGYIKVEKAGTLKLDLSSIVKNDQPISHMKLEDFRKKYFHITLSDFPWDIGKVEVYSDDVVIDGDLDLNDISDFTKKTIGLGEETNSMVFLKNLTVNGSIYSGDQDTDRALRVIGNLTAHNMILGGSQIYLTGKTKIRDVFIAYPDVDLLINDIQSSVYIKDHYGSFINIKKESFDYTIYFNEELADEEKDLLEEGETMSLEDKIEYIGAFFKGKKQTWINNLDVLSNPETLPFLTDKNIVSNIENMIWDTE